MTGYFSRLIQQTGIRVSGGHEAQSERAPSDSGGGTGSQEVEAGDGGDLLPVEEVEVTVPPNEPSPPRGPDLIEGEAIAPPIKIREEPQTVERLVEREIIPPASVSSEPSSLERLVEREIIPPVSASSEPSNESFLAASTSASNSELVIQERSATAVDRERIPRQVQESVNLSQQRQPGSGSIIPEETVGIEQSKEIAREGLSPQTYWQVVREWVGGTPQNDEGVQSVDGGQGSPGFEPTETVIVKEPQRPRIDPERVKLLEDIPRAEPQELVLSIGRIQVTVEQPLTEVRRPAPPAQQPAPRTQTSLESPRLRRHYIRLR